MTAPQFPSAVTFRAVCACGVDAWWRSNPAGAGQQQTVTVDCRGCKAPQGDDEGVAGVSPCATVAVGTSGGVQGREGEA